MARPNILINLKTYCQFPAIVKETLPTDNLHNSDKEESEITVSADNDVLITDEFNIALDEPDINFDNLKIEEDINTALISEETEFKVPIIWKMKKMKQLLNLNRWLTNPYNYRLI
jgi:hypothetical protein